MSSFNLIAHFGSIYMLFYVVVYINRILINMKMKASLSKWPILGGN